MGNILLRTLFGFEDLKMEDSKQYDTNNCGMKRRCEDGLHDKAKQRRTESEEICNSSCEEHSDSGYLSQEERLILQAFKRQLHINDLPNSILIKIFGYLSVKELLLIASLVCKFWRTIANDQDLWRVIKLKQQLKVDDEILARLTKLSDNVLYLDISDTKLITDQGFVDVLSNCTRLTTLKLIRCEGLRNGSFEAIGQYCHGLKSLNLENCYALNDTSITKIAEGCQNLEKLSLGSCGSISSEGISAIAKYCSQLQHLSLDQCCKVNDSCLEKLVDGCPHLECLCLSACNVTSSVLFSLSAFKHLRMLELARISNLRDSCIIHIVKQCKKLESLNLSLCTHITDLAVEAIAVHGHCMKKVYLVSCSLTDRALISLAEHSKTIEVVDVGWCPQITDTGTKFIAEKCKTLTYLGLMRCDKVDDRVLVALDKQYPKIHFSNMFLDCRRLIEMARSEGHIFSNCPIDDIGEAPTANVQG